MAVQLPRTAHPKRAASAILRHGSAIAAHGAPEVDEKRSAVPPDADVIALEVAVGEAAFVQQPQRIECGEEVLRTLRRA